MKKRPERNTPRKNKAKIRKNPEEVRINKLVVVGPTHKKA